MLSACNLNNFCRSHRESPPAAISRPSPATSPPAAVHQSPRLTPPTLRKWGTNVPALHRPPPRQRHSVRFELFPSSHRHTPHQDQCCLATILRRGIEAYLLPSTSIPIACSSTPAPLTSHTGRRTAINPQSPRIVDVPIPDDAAV